VQSLQAQQQSPTIRGSKKSLSKTSKLPRSTIQQSPKTLKLSGRQQTLMLKKKKSPLAPSSDGKYSLDEVQLKHIMQFKNEMSN